MYLPTLSPGNIADSEYASLQKALSAGYGTDQAQLTGGGALRIQSLDRTLKRVVSTEKHAVLFQKLFKPKVTSTVDEWTEQTGLGGFLGGSANDENGTLTESTGDYKRRVGFVKHLMVRRGVGIIAQNQNSITSPEMTEIVSGAALLAKDAEFLCYEGDSSVVPQQFDGIATQLKALNSSDYVIDLAGAALTTVDPIAKALETISFFGYGEGTDLFASYGVQSDLNNALDPAFRIGLTANPQEIIRGANVKGINTGFGDVILNRARFIRDEREKKPFEILNAAVAAANTFAPATVTVAAAVDAASKFLTAHGGNYYYYVTGLNKKGESVGVTSAQVAVAAGSKCTLTIAPSVSTQETGYVIYRSRKNGTSALADLREMIRIPKSASGNTVFVDYNDDIPGSTNAFILELNGGEFNSIEWGSFIAMSKIDLAMVDALVKPWAQILSGYLKMVATRHAMIKNIVTNNQVWKPFT